MITYPTDKLQKVVLGGSCEQNGVPTPNNPIDIVCNNGVVKVNTNLYWTEYPEHILLQTDGITTIESRDVNVSGMIDCRTIKSFKITTISPQNSFRIFRYGIDNTFIDASLTANVGDIITLEDNVSFFRIQYNFTTDGVGTENILIYNSAYNLNEIYTDGIQEVVTDNLGNTAVAEMLLKVGNYQDVQSIIDGVVTRNVGVKVLDGTENWTYQSVYSRFITTIIPNSKIGDVRIIPAYCSHFVILSNNEVMSDIIPGQGYIKGTAEITTLYLHSSITTVEDFKQYLADQYAAGTPVILVYPLATPTTEQVTPQPLAGNSVTQTAGSINNLPIESSTIAELKKRYIGDKEVKKVYIGDNLVWEDN